MNAKLNQMTDSMSAVYSALVENSPRAKLPEELFVTNFLPFFTGKISIEKNTDFLPTWISIAGTPAADVDIIDKRGVTLFTVPAFIDSGFINPLKNTSGLSYSDIVNLAILYGNNIPKQGANLLTNELEAKIKRLKDKSPNYSKKIDMWTNIFTRYKDKIDNSQAGTSLPISNQVVKEPSKLASNISDDDFE